MSLKQKILRILLCTLALSVCSFLCFAQDNSVLDSLQVKYEEAVYVYENGNFDGAKDAFTHVMQGAYQHLKKCPEDENEITLVRLRCIRYFILITRDQGDIEASNKWIAAGTKMASGHITDKETAKYWNIGFLSERRINEEFLASVEKEAALRVTVRKKVLILLSATACVLAIFLVILSAMFIKLRRTHRFLVRKNEEMASDMLAKTLPGSNPEENDSLPSLLIQYMTKTKAYLNPELSLNDLCRDLCTNRTYMSNAFSEMGTNFNAFVNKYRVSEAITLLSSKPDCSLQDIWPMCGFNSQSTFYSSFKNLTGLTPLQFRSGKN